MGYKSRHDFFGQRMLVEHEERNITRSLSGGAIGILNCETLKNIRYS
jgi:hypothetical protein